MVILGYSPESLSLSLKSEETGIRDFKNRPPKSVEQSSFDYHVRVYTSRTLKKIFDLAQFNTESVSFFYGYQSSSRIWAILNLIAEFIAPGLAQVTLIVANPRE